MARFKYLGEPPRPGLVTAYGDTSEIKVRCTPATDPSGKKSYTPIPPATRFEIGTDIGYDVTDATSLRMLRADTSRFQEII